MIKNRYTKIRFVYIELQPCDKPYHDKPHPVPRAHKGVLKKEGDRLYQTWSLKKVNRKEWVPPNSTQQKMEQSDYDLILENWFRDLGNFLQPRKYILCW